MSYIALAILGYACLAAVFVLDKFILTRSVEKPVVYTFYSTIFLFLALLAWPFGVQLLAGLDWVWALVSGLGFGFGIWTMFLAVKDGEASHINPFIGAIVVVVTFFLAQLIFKESLTEFQLFVVALLILATLLLAFYRAPMDHVSSKAYLWALLAGFCFASSHVAAKYIYEAYPFLTGFVWTRATTGFVGLLCLLHPDVRSTFKRAARRTTFFRRCVNCGFAKRHALEIVVVDKILGVVGVVLIQFAIAVGSVTIVNALIGVQYALMFLIIIAFTEFAPRVFKETYSKGELVVESVAIGLVLIGSAFFLI